MGNQNCCSGIRLCSENLKKHEEKQNNEPSMIIRKRLEPKILSDKEKKAINDVFNIKNNNKKEIKEYEKYSILILENKENEESEKIIDYFDELFFGKDKKENANKILYTNNKIQLLLSFTEYQTEILFSKKYNLVISFTKDKNEAISIISKIKSKGYIFKKDSFSKRDLLENSNDILSNQIILTNHYLSKIKQIIFEKENNELNNNLYDSQSISTTSIKTQSDAFSEILKCPISGEIMEDPVMSPGGHTYERKYIENWIQRKGISPLTKKPLSKNDLRINFVVKNMIETYNCNFVNRNLKVDDLKKNLIYDNKK
jgi:hypothetical protein